MVAFLRTALEYVGFPGGSESKESTCNAGNLDSILGLERFLEKERAPTPVFFSLPKIFQWTAILFRVIYKLVTMAHSVV